MCSQGRLATEAGWALVDAPLDREEPENRPHQAKDRITGFFAQDALCMALMGVALGQGVGTRHSQQGAGRRPSKTLA